MPRTSHGALLCLLVACALIAALFSEVVPTSAVPRVRAPGIGAKSGQSAEIGFKFFPRSSPWNSDVSTLPVHPLSATYLARMGLGTGLHADFGTDWNNAPNGIPYTIVHGNQPKVPITFYYPDESDPGPYPIPWNALIEGGFEGTGDRHILVLDVDNRILYEVYDARFNVHQGRWEAGSGAIWDLKANTVRPDGWTSADAAGLPMLPGLVRYDEVVGRGEIKHALRFTVPETQRAYVYPATHFASDSEDPGLPPMGSRVRLKAGFDTGGFPPEVQVILRALKRYGMIVADNGGPWYISGSPDSRWNDELLHAISDVKGSDFEVVDTGRLEPAFPLIYAGRPLRIRVGGTLSRWGCFTDPKGSGWTATVDYGDGSGSQTLALTGDKRFLLTHRFAAIASYRVTVRVRNAAGKVGVQRLNVVVNR